MHAQSLDEGCLRKGGIILSMVASFNEGYPRERENKLAVTKTGHWHWSKP